jgi:hypothetical protein
MLTAVDGQNDVSEATGPNDTCLRIGGAGTGEHRDSCARDRHEQKGSPVRSGRSLVGERTLITSHVYAPTLRSNLGSQTNRCELSEVPTRLEWNFRKWEGACAD